jgi:hypothetical protein
MVVVWLVGKTGLPGENHRPVVGHWQTLSQVLTVNIFIMEFKASCCLSRYIALGTISFNHDLVIHYYLILDNQC